MRKSKKSINTYSKQAKKDVLLVDLVTLQSSVVQGKLVWGNMGLRSMVSYLRSAGLSADVFLDLKSSGLSSLITALSEQRPLFLGFSPYQASLLRSVSDIEQIGQIVQMAKRAGLLPYVVLGGHFASFEHKKLMKDFPWIDYIVRGEGEATLCELVSNMKKGKGPGKIAGLTYRSGNQIRVNPGRPNLADLDLLPLPALDHLEMARKLGIRMTDGFICSSRGCYGNCTFCSIRSFYRLAPQNFGWRARSPESVVKEIALLNKKYHIVYFHFLDDEFMGPGRMGKQRAAQIADLIMQKKLKIHFSIMCRVNDVEETIIRKLKKAGLHKIDLGVESGSKQGLRTYNKGTNPEQNRQAVLLLDKIGILVAPTFIFINPYSTFEEVQENIDFYYFLGRIKHFGLGDEALIISLAPYSGTPIKERLEHDGLLRGNYKDGYSYEFKDKRMKYIQQICELFNQMPANVNELIGAARGMKKGRLPFRFKLAFEVISEAIEILEGNQPFRIRAYLANLKQNLLKFKNLMA